MSERTPHDATPATTAEQAENLRQQLEAAERGDGVAACNLGILYIKGTGGVRRDPKAAFRWFRRSALAGDPGGQHNLGACYGNGAGCEQSYEKAVHWYRRASAQQFAHATRNLGSCYLLGHGVPADRARCIELYRQAVAQGDETAADLLAHLGEPVDPARSWMRGKIRFVDVTRDGRHLGIVGVDGPPESRARDD